MMRTERQRSPASRMFHCRGEKGREKEGERGREKEREGGRESEVEGDGEGVLYRYTHN
jgi:hypothetical protein